MPYTPVTVERFAGLNLAADPSEVGNSAVDLVNVDFSSVGELQTRPGYASVKSYTMTAQPGALTAYETTAGLKQLIVGWTNGATNTYEAIASTGGAAVASTTAIANSTMNAVRFGTPTAEYLYWGNGTDSIWRWDGAAFSKPAGMPVTLFVAKTTPSNRLVAAFTSAGSSRVSFSNAGAPETWSASDFVDVAPGDGSAISGVASYQSYLFVFKRNRFFVFYGESTDTTGNAIFNYRTVDGFGSIVPPVVGDEGVYFYDGRTVWLTNGGTPTRISAPVEPFLRGAVAVNGSTVTTSLNFATRLLYSNGRLYVAPTCTSSHFPLVYDPKTGQWSFYSMNLSRLATVSISGSDVQYTFFMDTGGVKRLDEALTTDAGSGITWLYQTGFSDFGTPDVKKLRQVRLWGYGAVSTGVFEDYGTSDPLSRTATVTLGTSPAIAEGRLQKSYESALMSLRLSGTAVAQVNRAVLDLDGVKGSGDTA